MTTLQERLSALDQSILPVWVYDHTLFKFQWANEAALELWRAGSREELLARDLSDSSPSTLTRLDGYMRGIERGERVQEDWTLYPRGVPTTMVLHGSGVRLDDGRLAILFQAILKVTGVDASMVRGVEAVRHSSMMVSLLDERGEALFHNPAAQRVFGDKASLDDLWQSPETVRGMREALESGPIYAAEVEVRSGGSLRIHAVEARRTKDPVSGAAVVLIQQLDVTERRSAEDVAREQRASINELNRSLALVDEQRRQILALSAPVLEVGPGVLAVPLIGVIDAERSGEVSRRLLPAIVARRARRVILDLTGAAFEDASGAYSLVDVIRAVGLLGVRAVVSGIRADVAARFAASDMDLSGVVILQSLGRAIEVCSDPDR